MSRLVTRAEFARMAGVSGAAITKACKGALAEACVGKRIDIDHAAAIAYLASKGASPTPPPKKKARRSPAPTQKGRPDTPGPASDRTQPRGKLRLVGDSHPPEEPPRTQRPAAPPAHVPPRGGAEGSFEDLEDVADVIRPLLDRFGTQQTFKDWLDGLKKIEDIREKRLKNDETEAALIRREPVKVLVIAAIDAATRRVLTDASRTIVRRVYGMAKSDTSVEEAEKEVRELLGTILRPLKDKAARVLRDG